MSIASTSRASLCMRFFVMLGLAILLSACSGGGPLVKPGVNTAGSRLSIESDMEWTRFSGARYQVWTMDGELLNRLYLIPAVREREHVFLVTRQSRRRPDGAFFHPGARPDEIRDLIVDGLAAAGAVHIRTENLRPATFGQYEGVRFEVRLANAEGLEYQAMAAAFEHDRTLALALFIATTEYYYPRDAAKVDRMLGTLRWR